MFCGQCVHESRRANKFELCINKDFAKDVNFLKSEKIYKRKWEEKVDWEQECQNRLFGKCYLLADLKCYLQLSCEYVHRRITQSQHINLEDFSEFKHRCGGVASCSEGIQRLVRKCQDDEAGRNMLRSRTMVSSAYK